MFSSLKVKYFRIYWLGMLVSLVGTWIQTVAQSWLGLLADEELLAVSRQTLATRTDSLRLIQLRFDNGATSALELRQGESLLEGARVTLAQQQRQRALDENALVLLLGQALPDSIEQLAPMGPRRVGKVEVLETNRMIESKGEISMIPEDTLMLRELLAFRGGDAAKG